MYGKNPRSTAQIAGHPLHPMLIPFPIVSFIGALASDIAFTLTSEGGWATASNWLLGAGLVTSVLAAATGLTDYMGDDRVRRIGAATRHMIANVSVVVIEAINLFVRVTDRRDGEVPQLGLWLSIAAVLILAYSGWLGGELVYRHRVGVQETRDDFSGYDEGHAEGGLGIPRGPALKEEVTKRR
ncbi:MAG TPA: DUF2231 domain-containing protein [Sphingomicrobium sp.]|jgi:uncharacterized membrane protein|nr:DUF2231 domain-containing protein [Sphingomicrobium sp.]